MRGGWLDGTSFLKSCRDTETWLGLSGPECQFFPWRLEVLIETRQLSRVDLAKQNLVFFTAQEWEINNFLLMAFQVASVLLLPEEWGKLLLTH